MSLRTEQEAFTKDVIKLLTFIFDSGFTCTMGEVMRTAEQQKLYVRDGRSKTMNSYHLKKLAIDLNIFKNGVLIYDRATLQPIGNYWTQLSSVNQWGGNWKSFKDLPHFERHV